ncbi:MAG: pantetheine-phosphate adenylyltransferase [Clostridia bacterium]|nr:pantetheine-phosphate adenylyltransferase [Clostridia bacterium]MBQ8758653.1 pantetheine-phosphate adenylyltransferase [Clostridia bacterium]
MSRALIPGSYDPITVGHLDIIKRTAALFDEVVVLVSRNSSKNYMLCSEKRALLVEDAVKKLHNVRVAIDDGLLVDFASANDIDVCVKGIRNDKDYQYEESMAGTNMLLSRKLHGRDFETMYLPCNKEYADVSSTVVRMLLNGGADVSGLVPNAELLLGIIKG